MPDFNQFIEARLHELEDIAEAQLMADPAATMCLDCASARESG